MGSRSFPITFGECACYIAVTVVIYGRWHGSKMLTSSAGVGTKRLQAVQVSVFHPTPPLIHGGARGAYMSATAVTFDL